jgi:HPt (histidine-containing phosphotransfer) domain-containing protein
MMDQVARFLKKRLHRIKKTARALSSSTIFERSKQLKTELKQAKSTSELERIFIEAEGLDEQLLALLERSKHDSLVKQMIDSDLLALARAVRFALRDPKAAHPDLVQRALDAEEQCVRYFPTASHYVSYTSRLV